MPQALWRTSGFRLEIAWRSYLGGEKVSTASASMSSGASASSGEKGTHSTLRSWTTTSEVIMVPRKMAPVHPGEILMEEFLEPMQISQYRLSKDIGVPPRRINEIVHAKRAISPDTALRLSRYFAMSEMFWSNLQAHYDLEVERDRLGDRLEKEVRVYARAG